MKQAWLIADDNRSNNWIFFREKKGAGRLLREKYLSLSCKRCRKFDEIKAARMGIDEDVVIRSPFDFVRTSDQMLCVSQEFRSFIEELGNPDCEFIPLPGDSRYFLCLVNTILPCETCPPGMSFLGPCAQCGRFKETTGSPMLASLTLPDVRYLLCLPDVPRESVSFRKWFYLGSEEFVAAVQKKKFKGLSLDEAL